VTAASSRASPSVLCVSASQDLGGGEFVLLDTLSSLRARGVAVRVLNLAPAPGALARTLGARGADVLFCRSGRLRDPLSAIRILRFVLGRARGFDLALANDSRALVYTALACSLLRRPYLWHVHDLLTRSGPFEKIALRLGPAGYIAISQAVRQRLEVLGCPAVRIAVIPNAVDVDQFHPSVDGADFRRELSIDAGALVVGSVSRILPWKAVETLIEAAALLDQAVPAAVFLIVGDVVTDHAHADDAVRYRDSLLALRDRLGLGRRVRFVGYREDLPRVMAGLDLLVHTAIEEPFGRVLIEAMASGKPVVATRGGGVPEVVEDGVTGYLVPPRDSPALASCIAALADPEMRSRMGRAGRACAVSSFSLTRYGDEIHSLVARALSSGGVAARARE